MPEESKNQQIRQFLKANPDHLRGKYKELVEMFNVTTERVEHICRRYRKKHPELDPDKTGNVNFVMTHDCNAKDFIIPNGVVTYTGTSETTVKVNNDKGTWESSIELDFEPKNDIELAELHKIDLTKYKISLYWTKLKSNGKFTSSVLATLIKKDEADMFRENFMSFLSTFQPAPVIIKHRYVSDKPKISLVLPKQDAHFDKYDIAGNNSIDKRFSVVQESILNMLKKATAVNTIQEVVYIVGSDQFNAEWTTFTTKGTPQNNLVDYQTGFKAICGHEIDVLTTLLHYANSVRVVFIPGNHDEYVGWHLINLLETYFRDNKDIQFDSKTDNTKYHRFNNSAIMLNHGDAIKPKELAHKFPIGFKDEWSQCNHFYIFTGDKHVELSLDIHGIKFYQVPQLSSAKSKWDDKQGYVVSKAEMTAFVISETNGMTDIYKDLL